VERVSTPCTDRCWTQVPCPTCGDELPPRGRSIPLEDWIASCCEDNHHDVKANPRHLWNEHDSTRFYTDPEGWAEHEENCERCRPEVDE
jgi:hypothetical protein